MIVNTDSGKYSFYFRYGVFKTYKHAPRSHTDGHRVITCFLIDPSDRVYIGEAIHNPADQFIKEKGRKCALQRAIAACRSDGRYLQTKQERERIWWRYRMRKIILPSFPTGMTFQAFKDEMEKIGKTYCEML